MVVSCCIMLTFITDYCILPCVFADVVVVVALHSVKAADAYFPVVPVAKGVWFDSVLSTEFEDLFAWRDSILKQHWV